MADCNSYCQLIVWKLQKPTCLRYNLISFSDSLTHFILLNQSIYEIENKPIECDRISCYCDYFFFVPSIHFFFIFVCSTLLCCVLWLKYFVVSLVFLPFDIQFLLQALLKLQCCIPFWKYKKREAKNTIQYNLLTSVKFLRFGSNRFLQPISVDIYQPLNDVAVNWMPPQSNSIFDTAGNAYHLKFNSENHLYL